MNAKTISNLSRELSELPLDILGAKDLNQLNRVLRSNIAKIKRARVQREIDAFWNRLSPRARDFLPALLKKSSVKAPKKNDPPEIYENYFAQLKQVWDREGPTIDHLEVKLRRIREFNEIEGLNELNRLSAAERKDLSQYARLTILKNGKRSPLNLSASATRNRQWLDALRKKRLDTILDRKS
ncbi:MAG: hypothetical protein RIF32_12870 [Leptospirales bacterium]|jgi:hypothetical protein